MRADGGPQRVISIAATAQCAIHRLAFRIQGVSALGDPGCCWGHVCLSEPGELLAWGGMVTSQNYRKPGVYE